MKQRLFGSTDISISPLGLGTVKLGRNQGVKYPAQFEIPDDRQAAQLIARAKTLGINLIDTAPAYGNSEQRLGPLLAGQRQDWVICNKVGEEYENGESSFNFSAAHTRFSVERSLKRLQTDFIDIVLVHSDGNDEHIIQQEDCLAELQKLKDQGWIRAFGVSTKTVEGGLLAAQKTDAVMATYNLEYRDEQPVVDYCRENNKGLLIKKALASGHLCLEGEDPVQKSMDFIFSQPGVSSVIVGTINLKHLADNVAAVNQTLK